MFRFNHPKEAARLREKRKVSSMESPVANSALGGAGVGEEGDLHSGSSSLTFWSTNQPIAWIDSRGFVSQWMAPW